MPGAVWELPERAKAYLLDLLQGGGVKLHADYVDVIYRTLHDLGESPRTAFGDNHTGLSGVALNVELDPLLKKIARKRLIREAAYRRRNEMVLRILEQYAKPGVSYAPYRSRVRLGRRAAARPQPPRRRRARARRERHPQPPPRRRRARRRRPGAGVPPLARRAAGGGCMITGQAPAPAPRSLTPVQAVPDPACRMSTGAM